MRVSNRLVVQLVGDDRLVFVDDQSGAEAVVPISNADRTVRVLDEEIVERGYGTLYAGVGEVVTISPDELPGVQRAVEYFAAAAAVPLAEQLAQIEVVEFTSFDDLLAHFRGDRP
jgi:hypothetical protein